MYASVSRNPAANAAKAAEKSWLEEEAALNNEASRARRAYNAENRLVASWASEGRAAKLGPEGAPRHDVYHDPDTLESHALNRQADKAEREAAAANAWLKGEAADLEEAHRRIAKAQAAKKAAFDRLPLREQKRKLAARAAAGAGGGGAAAPAAVAAAGAGGGAAAELTESNLRKLEAIYPTMSYDQQLEFNRLFNKNKQEAKVYAEEIVQARDNEIEMAGGYRRSKVHRRSKRQTKSQKKSQKKSRHYSRKN